MEEQDLLGKACVSDNDIILLQQELTQNYIHILPTTRVPMLLKPSMTKLLKIWASRNHCGTWDKW